MKTLEYGSPRRVQLLLMGVLGLVFVTWAGAEMTPEQQATLAAAVTGMAGLITLEAVAGMISLAGIEAGAVSSAVATSVAVGGIAGGVAAGSVVAVAVLATLAVVAIVAITLSTGGNVANLGSPAGAGASGEGTDATAAANLAAAMASMNQLPQPVPFSFSVNPTTGELTATSTDGGPCCAGFTTNLEVTLGAVGAPTMTTPGPSDLPAIGESVPGSEPDASLDASAANVDAGEYGWIDGVCRHYATGLSCAEYQEHEEEEYRHHAVSWPSTWWVLLTGLAWPFYRRIAR